MSDRKCKQAFWREMDMLGYTKLYLVFFLVFFIMVVTVWKGHQYIFLMHCKNWYEWLSEGNVFIVIIICDSWTKDTRAELDGPIFQRNLIISIIFGVIEIKSVNNQQINISKAIYFSHLRYSVLRRLLEFW